MRLLTLILLLAGALIPTGCNPCSYGTAFDGSHHYYDCEKKPLPQWDFVWDQLFAYFGAATPQTITLEHWDGSTSRFHPTTMSIELGPSADRVDIVAHESTHLCNYNLSQGASTTSAFRFVDEGFAETMGYVIAGQGDWYRTYALAVAQQEMQQGRVSLAQVQDWSTYFGASGSAASSRNWRAYQVGSSFDFMLEDKGGAAGLRAFFADLGDGRDLGATFQRLYSATTTEIEAEWLAYLGKVEVDSSAPTVTALSPPDGATEVPLDTAEIAVTFSVAMGRASCLKLTCGDGGVCSAQTEWRARNVLAFTFDGGLKRGTTYTIFLGRDGCPMTSYLGISLPVTEWRFTTANE
jgi:hypothetical protein